MAWLTVSVVVGGVRTFLVVIVAEKTLVDQLGQMRESKHFSFLFTGVVVRRVLAGQPLPARIVQVVQFTGTH